MVGPVSLWLPLASPTTSLIRCIESPNLGLVFSTAYVPQYVETMATDTDSTKGDVICQNLHSNSKALCCGNCNENSSSRMSQKRVLFGHDKTPTNQQGANALLLCRLPNERLAPNAWKVPHPPQFICKVHTCFCSSLYVAGTSEKCTLWQNVYWFSFL